MTSQRHRFFRFLFIPLLILAVLLGLVLFRQHAGLPTRFSTQSNTPWNLILVNNEHALPRRYSPELTTLSNGVQVDSRIYPDLQSMFDDMRTEGVYPVVGEGKTRADHSNTLNQLFAAYARGKEAKELMVILGEAALSDIDLIYAKFADAFEKEYVSQGYETNRDIEETLSIGWKLLSILPRSELKRIDDKYLDMYYGKE